MNFTTMNGVCFVEVILDPDSIPWYKSPLIMPTSYIGILGIIMSH